MAEFMFATGIECSYPTIDGGRWRIDQLKETKHYENWKRDLELPTAVVLWWSGALVSATQSLSLRVWITLVLHSAAAIAGAAIYGRLFSRAANDPHGGW